MTTSMIVSTLTHSGLFASRIFLPLFVTSLAFFVQDAEWLDLGLNFEPPAWFVSWKFLVAAGVAAVAEQFAEENVEFQELTERVTPYIKSGVSLVWTLMGMGVISMDPEAQELLKQMGEEATTWIGVGSGSLAMLPVAVSGSFNYWMLALPVALGTFTIARFRNGMFAGIARNEMASELGVFAWMMRLEGAWVILSIFVLLLAPLLYLLLIAGFLMVSIWVKRRLDRKLREAAVDCSHCDQAHLPIATFCSETGQPIIPKLTMNAVGALREVRDYDDDAHAYQIASWGRCPSCGAKSRLVCASCKKQDSGNAQLGGLSVADYLTRSDAHYKRSLVPVFIMSLIPVLGIPLAALYSRVFVLRAYRVHFSAMRRSCTKVLVNLLIVVLMAVQSVLVPLMIFGPPAWLAYVIVAMTGPAFLVLSYRFYRKEFLEATEGNRYS